MQNEAERELYRAAIVDADFGPVVLALDQGLVNLEAEFAQDVRGGGGAHLAVDHQAHGAVGVVPHHEYHRPGEARIGHGRTRHQQLALKVARIADALFVRRRDRERKESREDERAQQCVETSHGAATIPHAG